MINDCYNCVHRRNVAGNTHIECVNPDASMTGEPHGIRNGWFIYPWLFDPIWMTSKCANFEPVIRPGVESVNSIAANQDTRKLVIDPHLIYTDE
jgi:hypothetical protein